MKPTLAKLMRRLDALEDRFKPTPLIVFAMNESEIPARKAEAYADFIAQDPSRSRQPVEYLIFTWLPADDPAAG